MTVILNALASPTSSGLVQNTVFQVMSEGSLKAVGRPAFTLMDKNTTPEARKYSATREFIYQTLCLAVYFAVVLPVFKMGAFKVLKKRPKFLDDVGFKSHNTFQEWNKARKLNNKKPMAERKDYARSKGAMELVSILGSAATLTIAAPQIVNQVIHPIMNKIESRKKAKNPLKSNEAGDTFKKTELEEKVKLK